VTNQINAGYALPENFELDPSAIPLSKIADWKLTPEQLEQKKKERDEWRANRLANCGNWGWVGHKPEMLIGTRTVYNCGLVRDCPRCRAKAVETVVAEITTVSYGNTIFAYHAKDKEEAKAVIGRLKKTEYRSIPQEDGTYKLILRDNNANVNEKIANGYVLLDEENVSRYVDATYVIPVNGSNNDFNQPTLKKSGALGQISAAKKELREGEKEIKVKQFLSDIPFDEYVGIADDLRADFLEKNITPDEVEKRSSDFMDAVALAVEEAGYRIYERKTISVIIETSRIVQGVSIRKGDKNPRRLVKTVVLN